MSTLPELTHIDKDNNPRMVDVTAKPTVHRRAVAEGFIHLTKETIALIEKNQIRKGNVLITAELAGVQAAKQTAVLIPLCHPLILTKISVTAQADVNGVYVLSEVKCTGQTGVEMEALTAVSAALLTIYDMCKAVDKNMYIDQIRLLEKTKEAI